jgi:hypothetical protein
MVSVLALICTICMRWTHCCCVTDIDHQLGNWNCVNCRTDNSPVVVMGAAPPRSRQQLPDQLNFASDKTSGVLELRSLSSSTQKPDTAATRATTRSSMSETFRDATTSSSIPEVGELVEMMLTDNNSIDTFINDG